MRRRSIVLAVLCLTGSFAAIAQAQGRVRPPKRAFLVLSEALATGGGGQLNNGTTIMHAMRVSAVARVVQHHGLDLTAVRLQTIFPSGARLTDLEYANPEGDALILSYAQLNTRRAGGIPSQFSFGGGVVRRQTSEAGRTRDTWIARIGYDADPPDAARFSEHMDATLGFNIYLMEARGNSAVYVAALGLSFRIG